MLRIPCPFLGAVRLADLPCAWGVQLGDRRTVVVSDGSAHGGMQGHAFRGAFIQDATRERMRLALLGMHHSVLPSSPRMTDRHSPAGTALPGSAVFSARALVGACFSRFFLFLFNELFHIYYQSCSI